MTQKFLEDENGYVARCPRCGEYWHTEEIRGLMCECICGCIFDKMVYRITKLI